MIPALENIQKKTGRNYFIRALVQDDNDKWVDFSDKVHKEKDRIVKFPRIKISTEGRSLSYKYTSSSGELEVDNSDGFWDGSVSYTFKTTTGATAVFGETKNKSEIVWLRRKIQFRLVEQHEDQYREKALGTFLIDDLVTSLSGTATLKLVGLERPLQERDASVIKNGQSWYQNRSITYLVKKLLELEYGTATNGMLPFTFDIDARIDLATFDGSFTNSTIGPPPMAVDTDGDGVANIFYEKAQKTRAICIAPATIGYVNRNDAKNTIYIGCDADLYSYTPATDVFVKLATLGYNIDKIWYNVTVGCLVIWTKADYWTDYSNQSEPIGAGKSYYYQTASGATLTATIVDSFNSEFLIRTATYVTDGGAPATDATFLGYISAANGIGGAGTYGPNICTNYDQFIRYGSSAIGGYAYLYGLEYVNTDTVLQTYNETNNIRSIFSFKNGQPVGTVDENVQYTLGQRGCIGYNKNYSGANYSLGAIFYANHYGSGTGNIDFYLLDVATGVSTKIDDNALMTVDGASCNAVPTCICADPDSTKFYIGVVGFKDQAGSGYDKYLGQVWSYDYSTNTWAVLTSTTNPFIPVELHFNENESTNKIYMVGYNQEILLAVGTSSGTAFRVQKINISTGVLSSLSAVTYNMNNQPTGFVSTTTHTYFAVHQTGQLWRVSNSGTIEILDNGFPFVEDSYFLRAGLVVDTATRSGQTVLWGVSSTVINEQIGDTNTGKNYLFKYDNVVSEFVELADFNGLSVWDGLGLLAQRANCVMGFNESGDFFFKKRSLDSSVAYTIDSENVHAITKERGIDEIFNYVEVTPYVVTFKPPEFKYSFQKRTTEEEETLVTEEEINIKQTDLLTKRVDLICVSDGDANVGDYDTGYPLFKYSVYEEVITGRFASAHSNQVLLNVCSTFGGNDTDFGIKIGYYLLYTDSDENEYYRRITNVDNDTNQITIDTAISTNNNEEFKVYRRSNIGTTSKYWSDEGVTYVYAGVTSTTIQVASTQDLSINTLLLLGSRYVRISAINNTVSPPTITVDRSITVAANDVVYAYFAPKSQDTWYEIGGTNVHLKIGDAGNKCVFKQGDRITLDCPGLVLDADDASKQVAVNVQSQAKYGKLQYPNINNRFLTRKLGKQLSQYVRSEYAFPKYRFDITMPLSNYLDIIGTTNLANIRLRSQKLLPYREQYSEQCRISVIEHDVKSGITRLELVASSCY